MCITSVIIEMVIAWEILIKVESTTMSANDDSCLSYFKIRKVNKEHSGQCPVNKVLYTICEF